MADLMQDKVAKYFKHILEDYVFIEFTPDYISKAVHGGKDSIAFMTGVPIPVRKETVEIFARDEGLKFDDIAESMTYVMGADMNFKHRDKYIQYMRLYNPKILNYIIREGLDYAEKEELEKAALHLRAALVIDPDSLDAIYNYGRACRHLYAKSEDPEFIKDFKAEATLILEMTTEKHPKFAQAYYFLGYQYINAGLYIKAQLTWDKFLARSRHRQDKAEIRQRLKQIERPILFERGYTAIERGKWQEGISILEPLRDVDPAWWNLFFFLGVGYRRTGRIEEAIELFKRVLAIKPSQQQTMIELTGCYEALGDKVNAEKYRKKAELVK